MEAHNEEIVPHTFNSRTPYEPGDDRDIWCKDCEYHRDHQIHIGSTCERERGRLRRAAAVIPLALIRPPRVTWAEWDAACEVLWPTKEH